MWILTRTEVIPRRDATDATLVIECDEGERVRVIEFDAVRDCFVIGIYDRFKDE